MKSYAAIALTLCSSLVFAWAAPGPTLPSEEKEMKAFQECNASATNPVQINPRTAIASNIGSGKQTILTADDQCVLLCLLQKIGFLDENANIRNGTRLVNYTLKEIPQVAQYRDVLITQIFHITRSAKSIHKIPVFGEKCYKAFVIYHQYANALFTLMISEGLERFAGVRETIIDAIDTGNNVDQVIAGGVKAFQRFLDSLAASYT